MRSAGYCSTRMSFSISTDVRRCGMKDAERSPSLSRRNFLIESHLGLGALALFDLLAADLLASDSGSEKSPLAPRPQQVRAKAKRCIFLFMEGGVSQMDTFEYRPALQK